MNKESFLLAIDGSQESLYAAEVAWRLAKASQAKVVAQTVVDSQALWDLIGNEVPGIIGSGPYLAAYEVVKNALRSMSETLLAAYEARVQGQDIEYECVLDEGNPVREIVNKASEHTLVIIGHRANRLRSVEGDRTRFQRYSLAEQVAHYCPRPLLIIQAKCEPWTTARLVLSESSYTVDVLHNFIDLTAPFDVSREVFCVSSKRTSNQLIKEVRNNVPRLERVRVVGLEINDINDVWTLALGVPADTLLMVATSDSATDSKRYAGSSPESFVRDLKEPAALLLSSAQETKKKSKEALTFRPSMNKSPLRDT